MESAKEKICLNAQGKGRFLIDGQKHIFSYQSHFSEQDLKWETLIDFPLYGRESVELEWSFVENKAKYQASYEQALLKNSQNLNPALLDSATQMWLAFFEDMLRSRGLIEKEVNKEDSRNSPIEWRVKRKELSGQMSANGLPAQIEFMNLVGSSYFGRFDFKVMNKAGEDQFGMELIVRDCLEKPE